MPLWFVAEEGPVLRGWTYAKSQKTKNLERDPRATLQIEDGRRVPGAARGDDGVRRRGRARARRGGLVGTALFERYAPAASTCGEMIAQQAPKRVGLVFTPTRTVTWDHRKLGGTY